ncbi:hypothetical protein [Flavobacterium granuli]|uniref:HORMA domain-containing protein n=1 Tax=Flavobacterium granuli TaxID=280093 RepID=A0A1M5S7N4_9FLAO|nr:hypothetical protein [Flavobacterium granuli]PRZ21237.1 hypothetical protein BC624_10990 [Flavobacterium granuli]SHH34460.1 hypothetical protein SAMN05443373_11190 [Flavobacterium granuli]
MHWETNEIKKKGDSIEINDTGKIKLTPHTQTLTKSNASFSIHGINYSRGLFPEYSFNAKKNVLLWPFPMLIVLDLNGNNDLDLNSARNEIVLNELWNSFEQNLAFIICKKLSENLKEEYINII